MLTKYHSGDKIERNEIGGDEAFMVTDRCIHGTRVEPWRKNTTWKTQARMRGEY